MKRQRSQEEKARARLSALYDSNEDEDFADDFADHMEEAGPTVSNESAKEPTFFVTVSLCML